MIVASTVTNTTTAWCAMTACGTHNPDVGTGIVGLVILGCILLWVKLFA